MHLFLLDAYLFWQTGTLVCFQKNDRLPVFRRSIRMAYFLFENRSRLWCEQNWAIWNWGYLKSLHNREGFKIPSLLCASWSYSPQVSISMSLFYCFSTSKDQLINGKFISAPIKIEL